jgi:GNAT superfamily N-acetyltransferase
MTITQTQVDVRNAAPGERSAVANTLSRAFQDDPVFRWIVPDDEARQSANDAFFALVVDAFWPHGEVHIAERGAGSALWLPPGVELVPESEGDAFGERVVATVGDEADAGRMASMLTLLDEHHPHEPAWFLNFLGVRPVFQGCGLGSAMLAAVLDRADRNGEAAYLDATSPDSRRLYERHGFEVIRVLQVDDSPPLWSMWRDPQPA